MCWLCKAVENVKATVNNVVTPAVLAVRDDINKEALAAKAAAGRALNLAEDEVKRKALEAKFALDRAWVLADENIKRAAAAVKQDTNRAWIVADTGIKNIFTDTRNTAKDTYIGTRDAVKDAVVDARDSVKDVVVDTRQTITTETTNAATSLGLDFKRGPVPFLFDKGIAPNAPWKEIGDTLTDIARDVFLPPRAAPFQPQQSIPVMPIVLIGGMLALILVLKK